MEPKNQDGSAPAPARHVTRVHPEAVYAAEYPKLVKLLVVMGATMEEAQDAAQEAMKDFFRRSRADEAFSNPGAYVRRAAIRFFVKARQRDRKRRPREIKGGHLTLPGYLDDELTACEDEEWVEHVLESLTPAQRDVFKLVMDGMSTHAIAEQLGKNDATIRQHLKNGRDRLLEHPEIAPRAPRELQARNPAQGRVKSAATSAPRKEEIQ
jgi:RNA polymerase sigma factor (sigma-70 family)